jgi:hypothetical protein
MKTRILLISMLINLVLSFLNQAFAVSTLSVSSNALSVAALANSTASLNVYSNSTWTVSHSDKSYWLLVNNFYGDGNPWSGDVNLTLKATANPNTSVRIDTLSIIAAGLPVQKVVVKQEATVFTLSVSSNALNIAAAANSTTSLTIYSNTTWTLNHSDKSYWLYLNNYKYDLSVSGNLTLTISPDSENPNASVRTDTLTITVPGLPIQKVVVAQAASDPTLSISTNPLSFPATSGETVLQLLSNTSWNITSSQLWLTSNPASGSGSKIITLKATDNPNTIARTAIVTISATGLPQQTITVTQAAGSATCTVSSTALSIASAANSIATFDISSNTSWTAQTTNSAAYWLNISNSAGSNNASITLTATANTSTYTRTATIIISATGVTSKYVTVTQSASPTLSVSPSKLSINSTAGTSSISIYSNASWTAASSAADSWLTFNPSSGSGNGTVTVTEEANPTTSERIATITVSTFGVVAKTITVTQAAGSATLAVSSNTLSIATAGSTSTFDISSNTSWTVGINDTWLTVNNFAGSNNSTITLTATANPNTSVRNAIITISAAGLTSQTITVTQAAKAATEVNEVNNRDNIIYPNPVKDNVYIRLSPEDLPSTIAVYNMKGQQVLLMQSTTSLTVLDMKKFLPGMYIIRIKTPNEMIYKKIMKD